MKYLKLFESFSGEIGDLNFMTPEQVQDVFMRECEDKYPNIELIRTILENGLVDINIKFGISQNTPSHWAIIRDNTRLAKLIIELGADINTKDAADWTPFHWAVTNNNISIARYLIEIGTDINAKSIYGAMPLHFAKSEEMKALLKQNGAVE